MTNEEAVKEVCAIGRKLEADLDRAEAERELRRWRPMPGGGHDPECMRQLQEDLFREGNAGRCLHNLRGNDKPENGENAEGAKK